MSSWVVIDTNVGIVANRRHESANVDCILACIKALSKARQQVVVVDDAFRIFAEYRRYLSPSGQPGPGDAFFKWLWDNQGNRRRCQQINITALSFGDGDFLEFPHDPDLAGFDRSDRKFVAVAIASGTFPPILNASDKDWWEYREALGRNGITVEFLCPELMNME
ncbi:MAG: hypothetical protein Q8P24_04600 [Desulfobacterales bacterium]|nr:hypothetical protein [Desulfobacterales bacterium]